MSCAGRKAHRTDVFSENTGTLELAISRAWEGGAGKRKESP